MLLCCTILPEDKLYICGKAPVAAGTCGGSPVAAGPVVLLQRTSLPADSDTEGALPVEWLLPMW